MNRAVTVRLQLEDLESFELGRPLVDEKGHGDDFAWASVEEEVGKDGVKRLVGVVHVRYGFQYLLWGLGRCGHEIEHLTRADFRTDKKHHPRKHLCGRSAHALRLRGFAHLRTTKADARALRRNGSVQVGAEPGSRLNPHKGVPSV